MGELDFCFCSEATYGGTFDSCHSLLLSILTVLFIQAIIPYVPTEAPKLDHLVYEMILAHYLANDRQVYSWSLVSVDVPAHNAIPIQALLRRIKEWPKDLFDISAVIFAIQSELDRTSSSSSTSPTQRATPDTAILMECLAELCVPLRFQPFVYQSVLFPRSFCRATY